MFGLIVITISSLYLFFVYQMMQCFNRRGTSIQIKVLVLILLVLAPFWDMILAKGIMWSYALCNFPLQKIVRTVEKPESVLWVDNVWPGYNAYGRHWMVENYLDGVHLKVLALNGEDGKIYLYRATLADFMESEKLRLEHERLTKRKQEFEEKAKAAYHEGKDNKDLWRIVREEYEPQIKKLGYRAERQKEIERIFSKSEIYKTAKALPAMNYRVEFQPDNLPALLEKLVWCDEIRIHDNRNDKNIAFSKRCLGYNPIIDPEFYGGPFQGGGRLGDEWVYEFDNKVLFKYAPANDECHDSSLDNRRG